MKKILTLLLFFLIGFSPSFSQNLQNANWYFGDSAGVHFTTSGIVTINNSPMRSLEGSATISDTTGNLLMFTNGVEIWNRNSTRMPNGFGLLGGPNAVGNTGSSSTNGSMILPFPNNNNQYVLINVYGFGNFYPDSMGARYSVIDITADGGLGDVVQKNSVLYLNDLSEKICAIRHANGRDWWVLFHEDYNNTFDEFLLDPSGFHGPIFQSIGDTLTCFNGEMIANETGNKIALVSGKKNLNLFSFDRCTGVLSDFINLNQQLLSFCDTDNGFYGLSFSPNGKFLYTGNIDKLYQYKLDSLPSVVRQVVFDNQTFDTTVYLLIIGQHQIAPNGKIYMSYGKDAYGANAQHVYYNQFLFSIDSPNVAGIGCLVHPLSVSLGNHNCIWGLPNFPNYNLSALDGSECDTLGLVIKEIKEKQNESSVYPNPVSDGIVCFHLPANGEKQITVTVTDLAGKICFLETRITSEPCITVPEFLGSGMYLYTVTGNVTNRIMFKGKIVVNR